MTRVAIITSIDRRSAIARATLQMAEALAEMVDVTIFAEPTSQPLPCHLPLRTIDYAAIRAHDHVVTVVGDSPFHVHSFWVARRISSVVILHDVLMAHLAAACLSMDDLRREFVRWYGPDRTADAMRGAGGTRPSWDGANALDAPLFEPVIELATGVVVHSKFAEAHLTPSTIAPVRYLPLAYESPWTETPAHPVTTDHRQTLLTLGHANQNKCHELVIEALADIADPTVRYVIAGSISDSLSLIHI